MTVLQAYIKRIAQSLQTSAAMTGPTALLDLQRYKAEMIAVFVCAYMGLAHQAAFTVTDALTPQDNLFGLDVVPDGLYATTPGHALPVAVQICLQMLGSMACV